MRKTFLHLIKFDSVKGNVSHEKKMWVGTYQDRDKCVGTFLGAILKYIFYILPNEGHK